MAVVRAGGFTQIGFLGHDAGHRQVFTSHRANYVLGVLLGNRDRCRPSASSCRCREGPTIMADSLL